MPISRQYRNEVFGTGAEFNAHTIEALRHSTTPEQFAEILRNNRMPERLNAAEVMQLLMAAARGVRLVP